MNTLVLVLVLNQLVMPGFGYLLVKESIRATIVMAIALLVVFVPIFFLLSGTREYLQTAPPIGNSVALATNALQSSFAGNRTMLIVAGVGLGLVWCYCLIDVLVRRDAIAAKRTAKTMEGNG